MKRTLLFHGKRSVHFHFSDDIWVYVLVISRSLGHYSNVADHNVLGADGERIAAEFLESKGLSILAKNYRKPYGEIDLVARETSGIVHFVEVKSVSSGGRSRDVGGVSHETYRPEDNVHGEKLLRLGRVIQTYIVSHEIDDDWQFDVITVVVDRARREARVKWLQDIII